MMLGWWVETTASMESQMTLLQHHRQLQPNKKLQILPMLVLEPRLTPRLMALIDQEVKVVATLVAVFPCVMEHLGLWEVGETEKW